MGEECKGDDWSGDVCEFASKAVYDVLVQQRKIVAASTPQVALRLDEELTREAIAQGTKDKPSELLMGMLVAPIKVAYGSIDAVLQVAREVAQRVTVQVQGTKREAAGAAAEATQLQKELLDAFTKFEYRGDAAKLFLEHLEQCWEAYLRNPSAYAAPYTAILQSSGFGKSRLLYQLAQDAVSGIVGMKTGVEMRVLYVCMRDQRSSGFPPPTQNLHGWLFGPGQDEFAIAEKLVAIYRYAIANWGTVGGEWLNLFTEAAAEKDVADTLRRCAEGPSAEQSAQRIDESATKKKRVVILAVDEARTLLTLKTGEVNYYRLLRRALVKAFNDIGSTHGIFVALVDTNPQMSELVLPTLFLDASSRDREPTPSSLLPPFVLSHTMDAYWRSELASQDGTRALGEDEAIPIRAYKSAVKEKDERKMWHTLVGMGRPMWASTFRAAMKDYDDTVAKARAAPTANASSKELRDAIGAVVTLAARKLLLGADPGMSRSYNEGTMFGVASMLCRLGLRPYPTSALASQVVSDFMAILVYLNYTRDGLLSSYGSDPVLALGATHVWYSQANGLADHILPQLKKLVLNEVLDTGGVREVIARIILLLVMDSATVLESEQRDATENKYNSFRFKGRFVCVPTFLKLLVGENPEVRKSISAAASSEHVASFKEWESKWSSWKMCFCQFVQLETEPTADTLWFLLARRAAGVLPRNQAAVDLVIPIFVDLSEEGVDPTLSVILVQVKNRAHGDRSFVDSAGVAMDPMYVFTDGNELKLKPASDMIRIYMSLRDGCRSNRFVYSYTNTTKTKKGDAEDRTEGSQQQGTQMTDSQPPSKISRPRSDPRTQCARKSTKGKATKVRGKAKATTAEPKSTTTSLQKLSRERPSAAPSVGPEEADESKAPVPTVESVKPSFSYCIRGMTGWPSVSAVSSHRAVSASVAEKLVDLADSLWKPLEYLARDLDVRSKDTNCPEDTAKVAPKKKLTNAARRTLVPIPGYTRNARKRAQLKAGIA